MELTDEEFGEQNIAKNADASYLSVIAEAITVRMSDYDGHKNTYHWMGVNGLPLCGSLPKRHSGAWVGYLTSKSHMYLVSEMLHNVDCRKCLAITEEE